MLICQTLFWKELFMRLQYQSKATVQPDFKYSNKTWDARIVQNTPIYLITDLMVTGKTTNA